MVSHSACFCCVWPQATEVRNGQQHAAVHKYQDVTKDPQQNACLCQSLKAKSVKQMRGFKPCVFQRATDCQAILACSLLQVSMSTQSAMGKLAVTSCVTVDHSQGLQDVPAAILPCWEAGDSEGDSAPVLLGP